MSMVWLGFASSATVFIYFGTFCKWHWASKILLCPQNIIAIFIMWNTLVRQSIRQVFQGPINITLQTLRNIRLA